MKIDEVNLKKATKAELLNDIYLVDEELSNEMYPVSWARCKELLEYKTRLQEELKHR